MIRKLRTEIMAESNLEFLLKLTEHIKENYPIEILEEPNCGMVMVKMREGAKKHLFYIGEVLVTECKVMVNGVIGLGIINGDNRDKAYHMAIIDAAYNADIDELNIIDDMLHKEKLRLDNYKALKNEQILKTKVDFETLDEEVKA